jgi:cephalosporin hydroxylase
MEYENKIYKESSLEHNDSISVYNGWGAQQNPNIFEVLHNFLNEIKPKQILEIGTSIGGLTTYIDYVYKKSGIDSNLISYDILEYDWYKEMRENGIDVRVEDVFKNNYGEVKQEVIDYIQQDGTTLILCDGGNKIGEFNLLSNFMKTGDYIMAHDYAENETTFKNDIYMKIWNWHEISDKDIEDACLRNNLKTYNKETFDKVVWVCKIKE